MANITVKISDMSITVKESNEPRAFDELRNEIKIN